MHAGTKIAVGMCGMVLVGSVLRATLPHFSGITIMRKGQTFLLPLNRVAFWACAMAAVVAGAVLVIRALLHDLGLR
jgi:hypothetical protein